MAMWVKCPSSDILALLASVLLAHLCSSTNRCNVGQDLVWENGLVEIDLYTNGFFHHIDEYLTIG